MSKTLKKRGADSARTGDGNEYDYMRAHNVRKIEIVPYIDDENVDESQEIEAVVIDYE